MLIDDLRELCARVPGRRLPGEMGRFWNAETLDRALVLAVDDVAAYIDATTQFPAVVDLEDIPNIAPLAQVAWCEWAGLHHPDPQSKLGGLLVAAADFGDPEYRAVVTRRAEGRAWLARWQENQPDVRWIYEFHTVTRSGPGLANVSLSDSHFVVYADGLGRTLASEFRRGPRIPEELEEQKKGAEATMLHVALVSVCFAHCKGVTLTDNQQPRQQRRAAEREGRPPLVTFRTINIAPVTRVLHEQGQIERVGLKKALHFVRGHFAYYTEEKPLFGKYTGTFYIPLHLRGTPERGVVMKDYRVRATEEQRAMHQVGRRDDEPTSGNA